MSIFWTLVTQVISAQLFMYDNYVTCKQNNTGLTPENVNKHTLHLTILICKFLPKKCNFKTLFGVFCIHIECIPYDFSLSVCGFPYVMLVTV